MAVSFHTIVTKQDLETHYTYKGRIPPPPMPPPPQYSPVGIY